MSTRTQKDHRGEIGSVGDFYREDLQSLFRREPADRIDVSSDVVVALAVDLGTEMIESRNKIKISYYPNFLPLLILPLLFIPTFFCIPLCPFISGIFSGHRWRISGSICIVIVILAEDLQLR